MRYEHYMATKYDMYAPNCNGFIQSDNHYGTSSKPEKHGRLGGEPMERASPKTTMIEANETTISADKGNKGKR